MSVNIRIAKAAVGALEPTMRPRLDKLRSRQLPTFGNLEVHEFDLEGILVAEQAKYLALAVAFEEFSSALSETQMGAQDVKVVRIRELVEAIDHLEDSIASAPKEAKALYSRLLQLPLKVLRKVLSAEGLEPDNPVGRFFDPRRHELLCTVHEAAFPNHRVVEIWRTGWQRGAELIRRAKVVVNDIGPTLLSPARRGGAQRGVADSPRSST